MRQQIRYKSADIIKADNLGVFEGYLVRFGSEEDKDLDGEYFSPETYFMTKSGYPIVGRPVNYQHGMVKGFGSYSIGVFTDAKIDDIGLFVRAEMHTQEQYRAMLEELNITQKLGLSQEDIDNRAALAYKTVKALADNLELRMSMGADPATWQVSENGHIRQAGIVHGALTPTPADPANPVISFSQKLANCFTIKANDDNIGITKSETTKVTETLSSDVVNPDIEVNPDNSDSSPVQNSKLNNHIDNERSRKMATPEQISAILQSFMEQLQEELLSLDGMTEGDASEMVEEVAEKMEGEMPEDVEELKSLSLEAINDIFVKTVQHNIPILIEQLELKRDKQNKNTRKALRDVVQHNAPAQSQKSTVGGMRGSPANVSVEEERKYQAMTAEQMALGVKLALAKIPEYARKNITLGDLADRGILSEGYIRTMAHKANEHTKAWERSGKQDPIGREDYFAAKNALPFKADELMASDITAQGAEWVERWYDPNVWDRARDETQLFNLMANKGMRVVTIPQGANGMNVKTATSSGTVYTLSEANSLDATAQPETVAGTSQFGTGEVDVAAGTHVLAHHITYHLEEDSIIDIVGWLNDDMPTTLAESLESAMLNGDTTATVNSNINKIDGTPGTGLQKPAYMIWDGIRHQFNVTNTTYQTDQAAAALSISDFENTIKLFPSQFQHRRNQMLFVVDYSTESALRLLPEVLTWGAAGQNATIWAGEIMPLFGVQLYMSGQLGLTNGDGRISVTGSNNTQGQVIAIYAPYWQYGRKRAITIEQDRSPAAQTTSFYATVRHAFAARGAGAAAGLIDITV